MHSWFISVDDRKEFCPLEPVNVCQNMKIVKLTGPSGAMMFFLHNYPFTIIFLGIPCLQLAVTVCCRYYKRSKKASKNGLAHPKDHLERSLRLIQATEVTPGPF